MGRDLISYDRLYIGGSWVSPQAESTIEVFDSSNGRVFGRVPEGTPADVNLAVAAAVDAFDDWSTRSPAERADYCLSVSEGLSEIADELADIISREAGTPTRVSKSVQAALPINSFRVAGEVAREYAYERRTGTTLVRREPVGIVGCITPWNYPLHQISAKTAFAMAAGCTVVLKPSEVSPLDAFRLAEVIDEVDLPAGVFNIVSGIGSVVGESLVEHGDINMISFTGSTRAGKRIGEVASRSVKRVALELGGKSANILLEDLDDDQFRVAVRSGIASCFINSGQTCTAFTRMLVPRSRVAEAEQIAEQVVAADYQPADPFADRARLGPLASLAQLEIVRAYIKRGIDEGAKLVCGGLEVSEGARESGGYYIQATVFSDVTNDMTIAREEIFGPVLSIIAYDSEKQAVDIANDSLYGLSGGVWGADHDHATDIARRIRTGRVQVNGGVWNPNAPFGGYKQSGYGVEYGVAGFEEFLQTKSMHL